MNYSSFVSDSPFLTKLIEHLEKKPAVNYYSRLEKLISEVSKQDLINSPGKEHTPLITAIKAKKPKAVKMLLEAGADPSAAEPIFEGKEGIGVTPLWQALSSKDNKKILKHLINHRADPSVRSLNAGLPCANAAYLHELKLPEIIRDSVEPIRALDHKIRMLGLRFGLENDKENDAYFAFYSNIFTYPELIDLLQSFSKEHPIVAHQKVKWNHQAWNKILNCLKNANLYQRDPNQFLTDHSLGKLVCMSTGWDDHVVGIVCLGRLLIKCDSNPGLEVFRMNSKRKFSKTVKELAKGTFSKDNEILFSEKINQFLKLSTDPKIISHQTQKANNCSWKSPTLVFEAVVYLYLISKKYEHEDAKKVANTIYVSFKKYQREEAFQKALADKEIPPKVLKSFAVQILSRERYEKMAIEILKKMPADEINDIRFEEAPLTVRVVYYNPNKVTEGLKFLVEKGVDLNSDLRGCTALEMAVKISNNIEVVKFLLANNADPLHNPKNIPLCVLRKRIREEPDNLENLLEIKKLIKKYSVTKRLLTSNTEKPERQ